MSGFYRRKNKREWIDTAWIYFKEERDIDNKVDIKNVC